VRGRLVPRGELSLREGEAMLCLLNEHFNGVRRDVFARDLAEKNWVLLIEDEGRLCGFTTLLLYETDVSGEASTVVYSGDTIMARESWGTSALARCWIGSVQALGEALPHRRLYWLLLTSGYRTYRFLPVFWRDFYPRFDVPEDPAIRSLVDLLAGERFGRSYLAHRGIVRFDSPQTLRAGFVEVPPTKRRDPHIGFFCERNPGWVQGDELVCLTEITPENLTGAGRRMWKEGLRTLVLPQSLG
jgi:hypothetical protein